MSDDPNKKLEDALRELIHAQQAIANVANILGSVNKHLPPDFRIETANNFATNYVIGQKKRAKASEENSTREGSPACESQRSPAPDDQRTSPGTRWARNRS